MEQKQNPMQEIKVAKVTLNVGAGKDTKVLEKGKKLLKNITGIEPVTTKTNKRIQGWGLRPGLPIGVKITLRGKKAEELIPRILYAKDNTLKLTHFDNHGNISFGIPEYVDIKDAKYDTEIGMMGLQATITLMKPGYRVKDRKNKTTKIGKKHLITKEQAQNFMKKKYSTKTGEDQ